MAGKTKKNTPLFPGSRIMNSSRLVRIIEEGRKKGERFCFILGSGASVESNIPSGTTLQMAWMNCLMGIEKDRDTQTFRAEETRELANRMKNDRRIAHDFSEIESDWLAVRNGSKKAMNSQYYFDIYKLRFYPSEKNGFQYLEEIMEKAQPSLGYHTLALLLSEGKGNNLVITLNFDSLVEDSLYLYTDKKPIVINHELLADYLDCNSLKRPIVAKLHHGLFFDPINTEAISPDWKKNWHNILEHVFYTYTPIVIGYGGGDNSLMKIMEDPELNMQNGLYWCVRDNPLEIEFNEDVRQLVKKRNGHFVIIKGFDDLMLKIGNALFQEHISVEQTKQHLETKAKQQLKIYKAKYEKLTQEEAEEVRETTLSADEYISMGDNMRALGEYEKAAEYYDIAIKFDPSSILAYFGRGCVYNKLKQYSKAIDNFSKVIENDPSVFEAYYNRGFSWYHSNNYQNAINDYSIAIDLDPSDIDPYINRGSAFAKLGEYKKAIEDFNKAIELNPIDVDAYNNRANAWRLLKEYSNAIDDCSKAIELDPTCTYAYCNRGMTLNEIKEYNDAIEAYSKALELKPAYILPLLGRAEAYDALGQPDLAEADRKKAAELESKTT
jgi:tetratricopeptide (TPR) repeat protein